MTELILRATPRSIERVVLKMKTLSRRLLYALEAFTEAKVRWRLQKAQRKMNGCRRLMTGSHNSTVKTIQIGQPNKGAPSFAKQEKDLISAETEIVTIDDRTMMLALSESRAYDSALEIREAYKLTGNFHVNLEIVLEHLAAFDDVTFEIEPKPWLTRCPDCRHVEFRPNENVSKDRFAEILWSIKGRIGYGSKQPWWGRSLHRSRQSTRRSSGCVERPCLNWKLRSFSRAARG